MNLESILINEEKKDYKCFDLLKDLLKNEEFVKIVNQGVAEGKISGFSDDVWTKIYNQNSMGTVEFEDVFKLGGNIGGCTSCSYRLSYSFNNVYICGGTLPWLVGTKNSEDGKHTWMVCNGYIYDTSLMLIIDESYAKNFGYIQEERCHTSYYGARYEAAKEQAVDPELSSKPRR